MLNPNSSPIALQLFVRYTVHGQRLRFCRRRRSWPIAVYPYAQESGPDGQVRMKVVIASHSTDPNTAACRAVLPKAFGGGHTSWVEAEVPAKTEKDLPLVFSVLPDAQAGRYVVPVDVKYGPWNLPQFAEAIVDVASAR